MRINQYIARVTGLSRRAADQAIQDGRVTVGGQVAKLGLTVSAGSEICIDGQPAILPAAHTYILLHKPVGYVCSRQGQGAVTIYDLVPKQYSTLKPAGRLDKDSSGLLLLTDDGDLIQQLSHPSRQKLKTYLIKTTPDLTEADRRQIQSGVILEDGPSRFTISAHGDGWLAELSEGRNRQIRRTLSALGYQVTKLHRLSFGPYRLGDLKPGDYKPIEAAQ